MKRCSACDIEKPLDQFGKNRSRSDGLDGMCVLCRRVYRREWTARNKGRSAEYGRRNYHDSGGREAAHLRHVRRKYGLSAEAYEALLADTPVCPVCFRKFGARPHVDHDHSTGANRGLLCGNCNRALGLMDDDPARLRAAAEYLERHQ